MPILRRIIFYGLTLISVISFFYTPFKPYIKIEISNLEDSKTEKILKIEGKELEEIYDNLLNYNNYGKIEKKWKEKLSSDKYALPSFFFKPEELPLLKNLPNLKNNLDELFLDLGNGKILRATFFEVSIDDFGFGSGFSRYPDPPSYILYPYRKFSLSLFILAVLLYFLIPFKKSSKNSIKYSLWRVFLSDFSASLLFFLFFSLPFFITGGIKQAISFGLPLTLPFWFISSFGLFGIFIAIWYEVYRIDIKEDGILIHNFKGKNFYNFKEMEYYQNIILKPPKWLIFLSYIVSFAGKGNLGRALILSSSEAKAISIKMKNGKEIYIITTDQMGKNSLKNFGNLIEVFNNNFIFHKKEIKEIRSMGLEIFKN